MNDQLTLLGLEAVTARDGFALWFRPDGRRGSWEIVATCPTERECSTKSESAGDITAAG